MAFLTKLEFGDQYGWGAEATPMDELRVVSPVRLVGAQFTGTVTDTSFWTASATGSGAATFGLAKVVLATGATADSAISLNSVRIARYLGGSGMRFRSVVQLPDTGTANNVRRWGCFSATDGAFFELSGSTFRIVTRKGSADTPIAAAAFNGQAFTFDTANHTYEIYFTNSKVWFVIDRELRHTVSASTTTWADTMHHPVRIENNNSGGSTSNVLMDCRTATIYRLGKIESAPIYNRINTTGTTILKRGPGRIHRLGWWIAGGVTNTVQLFDNIIAATPITGLIDTSSCIPGAVAEFGLDFYTGLTVVSTNLAAADFTVIYE